MKKRYVVLVFLLTLLGLLFISNKCYAADLDRIENYVVTVNPRMNDGSLDINYEITWRVLDSISEGPLEWVTIGTPNSNFDTPTAITKNIKSISKYNGSNVKIVFDKIYYAGQAITFKYSIHQAYMYKISGSNCNYEFTPAWFTDAKVDKLTVKWNSDKVIKSNNTLTEDNYLVWTKTNMAKGAKLNTSIKYNKSSFSALSTSKQANKNNQGDSRVFVYVIIFIVLICLILVNARFGGGGYYGHSGFYGGGPRINFYGGGCAHSSCACAHSSCASSCACACAGSGRAGCSKKDFYGTNITSKKIKQAF